MPQYSQKNDPRFREIPRTEIEVVDEKMTINRIKGSIEDYTPMYGMLLGDVQLITFPEYGIMTVNNLLYNHPYMFITYGQEIELNELDMLGFKHTLFNCRTENEVFEIIESIFAFLFD